MREDQVQGEEGISGVRAVMPKRHPSGEHGAQEVTSRVRVLLDCW